MQKYPFRLERDPVLEVVSEIRFQASVPDEAVYGIAFRLLHKSFPDASSLPIVNVPEEIRKQDPHLRYQGLVHIWQVAFQGQRWTALNRLLEPETVCWMG